MNYSRGLKESITRATQGDQMKYLLLMTLISSAQAASLFECRVNEYSGEVHITTVKEINGRQISFASFFDRETFSRPYEKRRKCQHEVKLILQSPNYSSYLEWLPSGCLNYGAIETLSLIIKLEDKKITLAPEELTDENSDILIRRSESWERNQACDMPL